jgi:hypothetical protein
VPILGQINNSEEVGELLETQTGERSNLSTNVMKKKDFQKFVKLSGHFSEWTLLV